MEKTLYNTQTRKPDPLPADQLDKAIAEGSHAFPVGERINVKNPDGEAVSLPSEQLKDAVLAGYRIERPEEQAVREYVDANDNIKGQAKVALSQFADEALMGVPETAYDLTADPLERAKKDALKKRFQLTNDVAGLSGFGASMLYGGPVGKVFGAAATGGEVASRAAAKALSTVGLEKGAQSAVKSVAARAAEKAVQMGVEGGILEAPKAITEAALGDPDEAGEHLLYGVGIGAGLGLGAGALSGAAEKLVGRFGKKAKVSAKLATGEALTAEEQALVPAVEREQAADRVISGEGGLPDLAEAEQGKGWKDFITKHLGARKKNAAEIERAYSELGLTPSTGALSDNHLIQQAEATLADSPTAAGIAYAKPIRETLEASKVAMQRSFGEVSQKSAAELGAEVKSTLLRTFENTQGKLKELYHGLGFHEEAIPVQIAGLKRRMNRLLEDRDVALSIKSGVSSPTAALAQKAVKAAESATTLGELAAAKRLLRGDVNFATLSGGERRILTQATGILDDVYEMSVKTFARGQMKTPEAKSRVMSVLRARKEANAGFRGLMEDMSEVGKRAGKSRVTTPGQFYDFLDDLPPEKLVEKLFTKKDSAFLVSMREKHPEAFKSLVEYQRNAILKKATNEAGEVNAGMLMREVRKLSPELRDLMVKDARTFKNASVVYETTPKPFQSNPSRTDIRQEFRDAFSVGENLKAAGVAAGLKYAGQVEGVLTTEAVQKQVARRFDQIGDAVDSFAKSHKTRLTAMKGLLELTEEKDKVKALNRLRDELDHAAQNGVGSPRPRAPEEKKAPPPALGVLVQALSKEGAPTVASRFQDSMQRAAEYLQKEIPRPLNPPSPFVTYEWKPSASQVASFERKLSTVLDPFRVIDDLKSNTLTREQMVTLNAVYPKMAKRMQTSVLQSLIARPKSLPYHKRLKLSLLMNGAYDPSLSMLMQLQSSFSPEAQARMAMADESDELKPMPGMEGVNLAGRSSLDDSDDDMA